MKRRRMLAAISTALVSGCSDIVPDFGGPTPTDTPATTIPPATTSPPPTTTFGYGGTPTETPTPTPPPVSPEYGEQGYGEFGYGGVHP